MQVMFENVLPQGYAITQRCSLDQGTFVYFMINALWLVATLALQFVGADLYIQIPSTKNEGTVIDVLPLAFMFLITFSSMLIVQFLAMLYHRLFTLLHVLSYVESSSSGQQSKRGAVVRDNKAFVNDGDDDDAQQHRLREIVLQIPGPPPHTPHAGPLPAHSTWPPSTHGAPGPPPHKPQVAPLHARCSWTPSSHAARGPPPRTLLVDPLLARCSWTPSSHAARGPPTRTLHVNPFLASSHAARGPPTRMSYVDPCTSWFINDGAVSKGAALQDASLVGRGGSYPRFTPPPHATCRSTNSAVSIYAAGWTEAARFKKLAASLQMPGLRIDL
ncbi:uncharacterized protein LOC142923338 isoform X1 [Petromyzon marinus]|uniref:uncharacterized protein LOC142923338 isoform X1 n=2 Tax=Petromyzon marinus TaxID=7757 RepID=UPI003F6E9953